MGYHWFDHDAIEDTVLDPLQPEAFVYEPLPNGKLHLVAVEWIVPSELWDAEHDHPPSVLSCFFSFPYLYVCFHLPCSCSNQYFL